MTVPFELFGSLEEAGDDTGIVAALGIGFLGLLTCIVIAVGVVAAQWGRQAGLGTARIARIVARLMLIGMWIPLFFAIAAVGNEQDSVFGPALWYFIQGVVVFALLALNGYLRGLWCPAD